MVMLTLQKINKAKLLIISLINNSKNCVYQKISLKGIEYEKE